MLGSIRSIIKGSGLNPDLLGGDGDLWLDADTVAYAIRKNGSFPGRCLYRIVIDNAPATPRFPGWAATTYRSTAGFTRHVVGTALGGGSLGAGLATSSAA
jgi:Bacterial HORMA domain 2